MPYSGGFVFVVKVNGKVLREHEGKVHLPFDTEYSLFLKNQHPVVATAKIMIDGTKIAHNEFIINSNQAIEIERFMLDRNLEKGKKFKFVNVSHPEIQDSSNSNLGNITVDFYKGWIQKSLFYYYNYYNQYYGLKTNPYYLDSYISNVNTSNISCSYLPNIKPEGIRETIGWSQSIQNFRTVPGIIKDFSSHRRLILHLKAAKNSIFTHETRTIYCIYCGKANRLKANYCTKCGKALQKPFQT